MAVKTWLKITLVVVALGMLGMCAIAGAGVYFVSKHVNTSRVSTSSAIKQFDDALALFKDQKALIEVDSNERIRRTRDLSDMPTAATKATNVIIKAWDPDEGRIVNLTIPIWVLAMGKRKVDLGIGPDTFDLRRLNLDFKDVERIGPVLLIDVHTRSGERVLIWTE
ncbi:MAG: hypothetical protein ABIP90_04540 [Vicinamibacterales bacterium]